MSELEFLLETARLAEESDDPSMRHLASPLALRDYVRMADETIGLVRAGRLLDWGCGYGQMSYLLGRRGLDVTSYDVGISLEDARLPFTHGLKAVRGGHPYSLPFRAGAFDAVLACGVLEHVAHVGRSLEEIRRVLAPGGPLLVYNLPQRSSYKELLIRRLHLGYAHERTYTESSIRALLDEHGFRVVTVSRSGLLPHLATGLPPGARRAYYRVSSRLFPVDRALSRTPVVNLVAESLEVVATKTPVNPAPSADRDHSSTRA